MEARALRQTTPHTHCVGEELAFPPVEIGTVACTEQVQTRDYGRDMSLPYK